MSAPEGCRIVGSTYLVVEYQMAAVNGEAEIHVVGVHRIDALILLQILVTISAFHDGLDVSSTIAIVSDIGSHLGTIHGSKPCSPVSAVFHGCRASSIAVAPTIVVGTYYSIFSSGRCVVEHDDEVVPVATTIAVVGEVDHLGLLRLHLDIVGVRTPEGC